MNYTLVIQTSLHCPSAATALKFAQALIETKHNILCIFCYGDGVHLANGNTVPPQDEQQTASNWRSFAVENNLVITVCIAAALKRGLLDKDEALRYNKQGISIEHPFELGGLGQLVEATANSDRVISF